VAGDTVETAFAVDCVTEVGMARWALDLSAGCQAQEECLGQAPALGSDGTIYVSSSGGGTLYAVNPDGTIAWSYTRSVAYPPALAGDGTIYASGAGIMDALDPGGALMWTFDTGGSTEGSTAIGADGTIFFGVDDKNLYALNPDGTLKWTHAIPESRFGVKNVAVGADGTVYTAIVDSGYGGTLVAVDAAGNRKWSYATLGQIGAPPAIGGDGTVYVGGSFQTVPFVFDGKLYALNPDGTLKWSHQTQGGVFYSPAIAPDGTIYFGSGGQPDDPDQTGTFYAVNPDGTRKWSAPLPGCVGGGATIGADGLLYVPVAGCVFGGIGKLVALNPDGTSAWDFQVGGTFKVISGAPALAGDGTLYLVSNLEGELYALKTSSLGLADSPWPRARHDNRNTSEATAPVP
jgi:outer membrane protein assembly factor BamB